MFYWNDTFKDGNDYHEFINYNYHTEHIVGNWYYVCNYGETMKGNLPYFYIKENLEKPRVYGGIDEAINKQS